MKKAIALILSLMLVLGTVSFALADTATAKIIPAISIQDFVGEWKMIGVLQNGKFQKNSAVMNLVIEEDSLVLSSNGQKATAPVIFDDEEGYLLVADSSGEGSIQLRDDGTIVFFFDSNDKSSYAVVFQKTK